MNAEALTMVRVATHADVSQRVRARPAVDATILARHFSATFRPLS
jgi:hypothetical protein